VDIFDGSEVDTGEVAGLSEYWMGEMLDWTLVLVSGLLRGC
jgi:hypothetical protein